MSKYPTRVIVDVCLYVALLVVFTGVYVPLVGVTVNAASYTWGRAVGNGVVLLCAGMYVVVPVRLYRRCRWLLRLEAWQCRGCGYDLRGLEGEVVCPECGRGAT